MNRVEDDESDLEVDYNQPCEFNEVAVEPIEDKDVKEYCPYKAFRPKNLRTKEEDEWWKAKFRRDIERRERLKVNDAIDDNVDDDDDDEISDEEE